MKPKTIGKGINLLSLISTEAANKLSFKMFTSPRPRKQKKEEVAFLAQAKKSAITLDGKKVQTYHWGSTGPRILFLHGWESNAGRWRSFVPLLVQNGYQVVAIDAPAHGSSEGSRLHLVIFMDAIRKVLESLGPFYAIAGHSMGAGAAVLTLATTEVAHPEKLILMGCFSSVSNIYKSYEQMLGLSPKLAKNFDQTIRALSGHNVAYYSIADKIKKIGDIAGLVIHDKEDKTIQVTEAQSIARNWAGARYIETEGFGHSLQSEDVFRMVLEFIQG